MYVDDTVELEMLLGSAHETLKVNFPKSNVNTNIEWKRPKEICKNSPCLFLEEESSTPCQGALGDCWLVAGCFLLSKSTPLLKQLFKFASDFSDEAYCGKWTINLYNSNLNKWIDVTIDDRLPVINNSLIFGSCADRNQFWFALLEKAVAKFYGSYCFLNSGQVSEAFILITGGFCWNITGPCPPLRQTILIEQLTLALTHKDKMLVVLSRYEKETSNNRRVNFEILPNHYYVIDSLVESKNATSMTLQGVLLVDPANSTASLKMPSDELCCSTLSYCSTDLRCIFGKNSEIYSENILSNWKAGINSGGRYGCSSYQQNPQYLVSFRHTSNAIRAFYVNLIQVTQRGHTKRKEAEHAIALHIWKLSTPLQRPLCDFSISTNPADFVTIPVYQYKSDISIHGMVSPSDSKYFVVIPSTYSSNINCDYHLRFYASVPFGIHQLKANT